MSQQSLKEGQHFQIYIRNIITDCEIVELGINEDVHFNLKCKIKLIKKSYIRKFDKFYIFTTRTVKI